MLKNIVPTRWVEGENYTRSFTFRGRQGSGFSFPSDKRGNVDLDHLAQRPAALENYHKCLDGTYDVIDNGVVVERWHSKESGYGYCCGQKVYLDRFTNTCDNCGTDYNSAGQELAPREQWGEETGESLADILRIR